MRELSTALVSQSLLRSCRRRQPFRNGTLVPVRSVSARESPREGSSFRGLSRVRMLILKRQGHTPNRPDDLQKSRSLENDLSESHADGRTEQDASLHTGKGVMRSAWLSEPSRGVVGLGTLHRVQNSGLDHDKTPAKPFPVSRRFRCSRLCAHDQDSDEHGYLTHELPVPLLADHSMAGRVRRPSRLKLITLVHTPEREAQTRVTEYARLARTAREMADCGSRSARQWRTRSASATPPYGRPENRTTLFRGLFDRALRH